MPPYVALAIVSMERVLGDSLILLTPKSVPELIGSEYLDKSWDFTPLEFTFDSGIRSVVARSDFIRMAYVYNNGGVWIDADTILLRNPIKKLFPDGLTSKLHWYSEVLFGSLPKNSLLKQAIKTAWGQNAQAWGNPGEIKSIIASHPECITVIPSSIVDPGYRPIYNFGSCDVMRRCDIEVESFLINDIDILKLYNTYFTRTTEKQQSVAEFLAGNTLLAKLFLHLEPDADYWISMSENLISKCQL